MASPRLDAATELSILYDVLSRRLSYLCYQYGEHFTDDDRTMMEEVGYICAREDDPRYKDMAALTREAIYNPEP